MYYVGPKGLWGLVTIIIFIGIFFYQKNYTKRAESWPEVDGVILKSDINEITRRSKSTFRYHEYSVYVNYEYLINNVAYTGNNLGFESHDIGPSSAKQLLASYPTGKAIKIRYNPEDPSQSMLLK